MKKLIAVLLLAVVIALPLVSCANGAASDAEYIEKKGTLVIGITYFEPMNYMENGELTGFETEFAIEVCKIIESVTSLIFLSTSKHCEFITTLHLYFRCSLKKSRKPESKDLYERLSKEIPTSSR